MLLCETVEGHASDKHSRNMVSIYETGFTCEDKTPCFSPLLFFFVVVCLLGYFFKVCAYLCT